MVCSSGGARRLPRAPCSRDSLSLASVDALGARTALTDLDSSHQPLGLVPYEINGQETVVQLRTADLDAICQHERALELTSCYASVEIFPALVVLLLAPDRQLIVVYGALKLVSRDA